MGDSCIETIADCGLRIVTVSLDEQTLALVRVTDRFGSYGLAGLMIFRADSEALTTDTFLLSCRALGRGVEHRMIARLGEIALERGLARVEIPFIAGQRNRPAWMFLKSLREPGPDSVFRFPAAEAAA